MVTLGLVPLTLALFQQVSLIAPLANAVAIPVVTLGVVPLALAGIVVPFDFCFAAAHAVLAPLMQFLERLAALPDATWQQHAPPAWTLLVATGGDAVAAGAARRAGTRVGCRGPAAAVRRDAAAAARGAFRMTVLDVGQGLAVVVETHRHTLVYDTGPRYTETADAGGRIVAPFLRASGLRRADGLVVSHQDLDHAGGARSLLQATPVGWFASSLPAEHAVVQLAQRARGHGQVRGRTGVDWDGVRFSMLHPSGADYDDAYGKTNDLSCVVRVDSAHGSALLAGDIEAKSEAALLRARRDLLRADVLVVPHHGSRTSSTSRSCAPSRRRSPSSPAGTATASAIRVPTSSRATRRSAHASCAPISTARSR